MSKKFITFILSFIILTNFSHGQVDLWKILTTKTELYSIKFFSESKGWIFAGSYVRKTIDGGQTWSTPVQYATPIGYTGGSYSTYPNSLFIIDNLNGWACRGNQDLARTVNGGEVWGLKYPGINNSHNYLALSFINAVTGYAAGEDSINSKGVLIRSTNSGVTWTLINNDIKWPRIRSFQMINQSKGFMTFYSKDTFAVTNDGGLSWSYKHTGLNFPITRVYFIDSLNGWIVGERMFVSRTTDGGNNWINYSNSITNLTNCYFLNAATGWACTMYGSIWKTTNSGMNWIMQFTEDCILRDVFFKNSQTGWVVDMDSRLLMSTNGGVNWSEQIYTLKLPVVSLSFVDINTGFALTNYQVSSAVWKTTDRGYNWTRLCGLNAACTKILFLNSQSGYICRTSTDILKTTNGGINWTSIYFNPITINSIIFINPASGWCVGSSGKVFKTSDGGSNWQQQTMDTTVKLNDVQFIDSQNGMIAGEKGFIFKTSNGGSNWFRLYPYGPYNYNGIFLLNSLTGFATGTKSVFFPPYYSISYRALIKTTNSGGSWAPSLEESTAFEYGAYNFRDMCFIGNSGWLIKSNNEVVKTSNAGGNWFSDQPGLPVNETLNCIRFTDETNGWIGGSNGTILSTAIPIGIRPLSSDLPEKFFLSQNYPNPFNPMTKIRFDLPQQSQIRLIVYDVLGREVATLVKEQLKPGTYEVDWDGSNFSSGVYFYKLIGNEFTETKKMILIK